jgi:hypothetical protein
MSRHTRRNLLRGIPQPLESRPVPFRRERHGKPTMVRKRSVKIVDGLARVIFEWVPVTPEMERHTKVAAGPTGRHGKQNTAPKRPGAPK